MKFAFIAAAVAAACCAPAYAQDQVSTLKCDAYLEMDNTEQMAVIAELDSVISEMGASQDKNADMIHERLAADCAADDDVLVVDAVREFITE